MQPAANIKLKQIENKKLCNLKLKPTKIKMWNLLLEILCFNIYHRQDVNSSVVRATYV